MSSPPLFGLLLAGGKSRRMGQAKADLVLDGSESLRDRGLRLLGELTDEAFLSIAANDQQSYPCPTIPDLLPELGPLGGLHSALHSHPNHAWIMLACDLPNLTAEALQHLISHRDPTAEATCFRSEHDEQPEPLCAIYEPSAAAAVASAVSDKRLCARHFLSSLKLTSIPLPAEGMLQNCNRPEDLEEFRLLREVGRVSKSVTIEYFAKLRDEAGTNSEQASTEAATAAGLWDEARMRHSLSMDLDTVRLAINDEFSPWTTPLQANDRIAFMPPFAGG